MVFPNFIIEKKCPSCNSREKENLFCAPPCFVSICKKCGLVRLNPHWTKQKYNTFYREEYDSSNRPLIFNEKIKKSSLIQMRMCLKKANSKLIPQNILDIGSGTGENIISMKNLLWPSAKYFAIEPSNFCKKKLIGNNISVLSSDVESNWVKEHKNKFDLIILKYVLEHLLHPISVLKKIRKTLTEKGVIYIAVPNLNCPDLPLRNFFEVPHAFYFTKNTLKNIILQGGFEPLLIWDDNKLYPKLIFALCKKSQEKQKVKINIDEYFKSKNLIFFNLTKENSEIYLKKLLILKKIKAKLRVPLNKMMIFLHHKFGILF